MKGGDVEDDMPVFVSEQCLFAFDLLRSLGFSKPISSPINTSFDCWGVHTCDGLQVRKGATRSPWPEV